MALVPQEVVAAEQHAAGHDLARHLDVLCAQHMGWF